MSMCTTDGDYFFVPHLEMPTQDEDSVHELDGYVSSTMGFLNGQYISHKNRVVVEITLIAMGGIQMLDCERGDAAQRN